METEVRLIFRHQHIDANHKLCVKTIVYTRYITVIDHQMLLRKAPGNNQFVLQHLLGTNPVLYTATGWLKATRENPVAKSAITILQESTR